MCVRWEMFAFTLFNWQESTCLLTCAVLKFTPSEAVQYALNPVHDHECERRVKNELAVCESLSGSATPWP